jgi:hypothetical protein
LVFLYSGKKLVSLLGSFSFPIAYRMTVICFIFVLDIDTVVDSHVSQDTCVAMLAFRMVSLHNCWNPFIYVYYTIWWNCLIHDSGFARNKQYLSLSCSVGCEQVCRW